MRNLLVVFLVDSMFLPQLCLLEQIVIDRAATAIHATGHQLLSFCHSLCAEEKTQILNPVMNIKYLPLGNCGKSCPVYNILFMLTELIEILDQSSRGPSQSLQRASETSDTSGDDSDHSKSSRKVLSEKNFPDEEEFRGGQTRKAFCHWANRCSK